MENNLKAKKNIEKRFKVWVYVVALYLSFVIGGYFNSEITVYSIIGQLNMLFSTVNGYTPYGVAIVLKLVVPLISLALFEIFSRVFYSLCNTFSLGAVTMTSNDFVRALRIFVILENLALGALNLLFYFFNFLIPLGMVVLSFAITTTAYTLFFMYINKHYLDKKTAYRAFRIMAVLYLAMSFVNIAGGTLI